MLADKSIMKIIKRIALPKKEAPIYITFKDQKPKRRGLLRNNNNSG